MTRKEIHILSLGAGVQSSTLALRASKGEIGPMPVAGVFADTQREPAEVYHWLSKLCGCEVHQREDGSYYVLPDVYQSGWMAFPVYIVTAGDLGKKVTTPYFSSKNKKMVTMVGIPAFILNPDGTQGIMSRQCTRDYKIAPVDKIITQLMRQHKVRHAVKWMGISLDEISRVKDSRRKTVTHRYPFVESRETRHDCLLWLERNGYPKAPRSACTFCPYRANREWRALSPEEFAGAVEFEKKLQAANAHEDSSMIGVPWLHRSMIPLDQVDLSTEEERGQLSMFNNECEGMCGV